MKGKFVTFEGCEGSGKTTQMRFLKEYLEKEGVKAVFTREPGGNPISEKIRSIILDKENEGITPECEALLYAAARVQVLNDVISPTLNEGTMVVCDRFIDSSLAYQGEARGLGFEFIERINSYAFEKFSPDITIFLDLPPEAAFLRKHGADEEDRMEREGLEFHKKVYEGYKKIEKLYPERFVAIDCSGEKEETKKKILKALRDKGVI